MFKRSKKDQPAKFPREIIEILGYSGGRGGLNIDFVVGSLNQDDDEALYCHLHFSDIYTFRYHADESYQIGFWQKYVEGSDGKLLNENIPDLIMMESSPWMKEFLAEESHVPFMNSEDKFMHYRLFAYPAGVFDIISSDKPTLKVN